MLTLMWGPKWSVPLLCKNKTIGFMPLLHKNPKDSCLIAQGVSSSLGQSLLGTKGPRLCHPSPLHDHAQQATLHPVPLHLS